MIAAALRAGALRRRAGWLLAPVVTALVRARVPATLLTLASLPLAGGAALALARGQLPLGGWLFLAAGLCDALDGAVARRTRTAGASGALLDSVVDRTVEAVVHAGLAWHWRDSWLLGPVLGSMWAGLVVSYVRARGEALGVDCSGVGLMQRPARVLLLGAALTLSPFREGLLPPALVLLGVMTSLSALQRFRHAYTELARAEARPSG